KTCRSLRICGHRSFCSRAACEPVWAAQTRANGVPRLTDSMQCPYAHGNRAAVAPFHQESRPFAASDPSTLAFPAVTQHQLFRIGTEWHVGARLSSERM